MQPAIFTQTQLREQKKPSQQVDSLHMKQALGDVCTARGNVAASGMGQILSF